MSTQTPSSTPAIGDRRRAAVERAAAARRHPSGRTRSARPVNPPPTAFYLIGLIVVVFVMLGLVMVLSASSVDQFHKGNSPWRIFNRQVVWAVFGAVALWIFARIDMDRWRRYIAPAFIASSLGMLLPFVPGIGQEVNDANAWVAIGGFSFQPSEFMKLAVLVFCCDLLARRSREMNDLRRTLVPALGVALIGAVLCLLQGDLGSAIVMSALVFAIIFLAGAPLTPLLASGAAGIGVMLLFVFSSQRRYNRFTAFLDVTGHRDAKSYQTYQAWIMIAQGGPTGTGPGRGLNKLGDFLPLAHSDFIFAVIAEELGLMGVVAVIGGFLVLAFCGVQVALAARDSFGLLLAGGIVAWLVVQTLINVGGVTGLMPVTGLTLPYFSAGGSSLFVSMAAAGLLLNVARHAK